MRFNVKHACIFDLILVDIPCSLILPIKDGEDRARGDGGWGGGGERVWGFLLNDQNLLSMTKVVCRGSLSGWLLSLEFKVYLKKFIPFPEM